MLNRISKNQELRTDSLYQRQKESENVGEERPKYAKMIKRQEPLRMPGQVLFKVPSCSLSLILYLGFP